MGYLVGMVECPCCGWKWVAVQEDSIIDCMLECPLCGKQLTERMVEDEK